MNSNLGKQKFFLIYQIKNLINGKIYVGAHCTYNVDDKYMGSSKYLKKDLKELGRHNFEKTILYVFDNKEGMMAKEAEIVNKEFCYRTDTYNKMVGGISEMSWKDMILVKDKNNTIHSIYRDDPRFLSGELVGIAKGIPYNKGKLTVIDKEGNTFQTNVDDPRYKSGELKRVGKTWKETCDWTGRKRKQESKNKIGQANSKIQSGEGNSQYGKKRSLEFKMAMKEKFSDTFYVYDKDGKFVSEEMGINDYAKRNGLDASCISKVLRGKNKHHMGLKFYYEEQ